MQRILFCITRVSDKRWWLLANAILYDWLITHQLPSLIWKSASILPSRLGQTPPHHYAWRDLFKEANPNNLIRARTKVRPWVSNPNSFLDRNSFEPLRSSHTTTHPCHRTIHATAPSTPSSTFTYGKFRPNRWSSKNGRRDAHFLTAASELPY